MFLILPYEDTAALAATAGQPWIAVVVCAGWNCAEKEILAEAFATAEGGCGTGAIAFGANIHSGLWSGRGEHGAVCRKIIGLVVGIYWQSKGLCGRNFCTI